MSITTGMRLAVSSPPPGWYPDPHQPGLLRWWDGAAWTGHTGAPGFTGGRTRSAASARLWWSLGAVVVVIGVVGFIGLASLLSGPGRVSGSDDLKVEITNCGVENPTGELRSYADLMIENAAEGRAEVEVEVAFLNSEGDQFATASTNVTLRAGERATRTVVAWSISNDLSVDCELLSVG